MAADVVISRAPTQVIPTASDCLLVVDIQNDFLTGGSLPVPNGEQVIPPLNEYIMAFIAASLPIIASRDWHPQNHCSFRTQGGPWPPHCVAGTAGAGFAVELALPANAPIISKATSPARESYSDFENTGLSDRLHESRVNRVFVGGLATEYCVRATVEDALRLRFQVVLLIDAIRPLNVEPLDGQRALEQMIHAGAICAMWRTWPDGTRRITVAD